MESLFITSPLSKDDSDKIAHDLVYIADITHVARQFGLRTIISGGYAVDGALGQITRPHDDIDIQIYGREPDAIETINKLMEQLPWAVDLKLKDMERKEYYHYLHLQTKYSLIEFYYLHVTTDPFAEEKVIQKSDGSLTLSHTYNTATAVLMGITFEIQNPTTELVDKMYKREHRGDPKKSKHEQDIHNLLLITDNTEVKKALDKLILNS